MKNITISLNEKEHKALEKITKKNGTTKYSFSKEAVKEKMSKFLKDQKAVGVCSFYWLLCYALIVVTVTLI